MNKAKEALKAELLELYSQGLGETLEDCPERADFAVLEAQVEKPARQTLPETLGILALKRGIFSPKLFRVPGEATKER